MRVLVVEDEERIARFLVKGLRRAGHAADHAATGHAALDALARERYDVVTLDLRLPDVDGLDVLRALRTRGHATPVIVLTAYSSDAADEAVALGARALLGKPVPLPALLARVEAVAGT